MKAISKEQIKCISALINKLGLQDYKASLVWSYTGERTESRSDMTSGEAIELIKYLKSTDPDEIAAERMRRKIISMAHEMSWRISGTTKVDMKRVDGWCIQFGRYHKHLNSHTKNELPYLVTQFETVYNSFLKAL